MTKTINETLFDMITPSQITMNRDSAENYQFVDDILKDVHVKAELDQHISCGYSYVSQRPFPGKIQIRHTVDLKVKPTADQTLELRPKHNIYLILRGEIEACRYEVHFLRST